MLLVLSTSTYICLYEYIRIRMFVCSHFFSSPRFKKQYTNISCLLRKFHISSAHRNFSFFNTYHSDRHVHMYEKYIWILINLFVMIELPDEAHIIAVEKRYHRQDYFHSHREVVRLMCQHSAALSCFVVALTVVCSHIYEYW